MRKNKYHLLSVFLTIIAVYNILVFTIAHVYSPAFWSAYAFTMFSMTATLVTYLLAFRHDKDATFMNLPITIIASVYFFVQLFLGIIVMLVPNLSVVVANIIQIVVLAAFAIATLGGLIGKNYIVDSESTDRRKVFYIKSLASEVERLIAYAKDSGQKKALTEVYEAIRYSDPMSNSSLTELEERITADVAALSVAVNNGGTEEIIAKCVEIKRLVAERERKCKLR